MINKKWSWKWEKNTTTKKKMRYIACYDYHSQLTVLQKAPSTLFGNFQDVLKDSWHTLHLTFAISLIFFIIRVAFFLALFSRESRLYKRVCLSVRPSVHPSVCPSVTRFFFGRLKMRKIELEADEGVSERRGGQRLDNSRLIFCIRTCIIIFCGGGI